MGQLLQLIQAATRRADKDKLNAWFEETLPIQLPHIASVREFPAASFQTKLRAFNQLHHWPHDHLHPCFAQLLGLSQHIGALADKASPFPLIGLVQTSNRIEMTTPLRNDSMSIQCQFSEIARHPHGITVDIDIIAMQQGKQCVIARSTYLYRLASDRIQLDASLVQRPTPLSSSDSLTEQTLQIPGDAGRNYARLSGDYNPIHYYNWAAKRLGFRSSIAHGMHVLALTLSALEQHAPTQHAPVVIDNTFLYPTPLPCDATVRHTPSMTEDSRPLSFELINPRAAKRKQILLQGQMTVPTSD